MIERIIEAAFTIASESEEDFEEGEETPHQLGIYVIQTYTCEITYKVMYPIVMKFVERFGQSQKELERKAAIKVLGYIADPDSCLDPIKENIVDVTEFIVKKL